MVCRKLSEMPQHGLEGVVAKLADCVYEPGKHSGTGSTQNSDAAYDLVTSAFDLSPRPVN